MKITVGLSENSQFKSIQGAIDSIPKTYTDKVQISIKKGIYYEKILIKRSNITLIGENKENTIITYDDYARKVSENGKEYGTFNSFSIYVEGENFEASNITFQNRAGFGEEIGQALAVYVNADKSVFRNCKFTGNQDTLFTGPLPGEDIENKITKRNYFEDCYICGNIDFIFGSATVVFNRCEIFSKNINRDSFITAASTPKHAKFGYVFIDCKLSSDSAENTVYLGRPWREYAKTVFINTWMDKHIKLDGWHEWDKENVSETTFYAEYNSRGPGGRMDKRKKWAHILTDEDAKVYTIKNILSGNDSWNPDKQFDN